MGSSGWQVHAAGTLLAPYILTEQEVDSRQEVGRGYNSQGQSAVIHLPYKVPRPQLTQLGKDCANT